MWCHCPPFFEGDRCERRLNPSDYPGRFYGGDDDDERDVNSAVKTTLTVLGKISLFSLSVHLTVSTIFEMLFE